MTEKTKRKVGRPSKFDPVFCEQVVKLCRLGAKDEEIADFFHVTVATLNTWKLKDPVFLEALKEGKKEADANVANSLYHRAIGFEHEDTHISNYQGEITKTPVTKRYPPDTTACIFWLKNRDKENWRDVRSNEHTGKDGGPIETKEVDEFDAARRMLFLFERGTRAKDEEMH